MNRRELIKSALGAVVAVCVPLPQMPAISSMSGPLVRHMLKKQRELMRYNQVQIEIDDINDLYCWELLPGSIEYLDERELVIDGPGHHVIHSQLW